MLLRKSLFCSILITLAGSVLSAQVPAAPTGLTAVRIASQQIDLSWNDHASVEQSYRLERSPDGLQGWLALDTALPANSTTFSDASVSEGAYWYYRVRAENGSEHSAWSNIFGSRITPDFSNLRWSSRNPTYASDGFHASVWTGTHIVLVGEGGRIHTSRDGHSWTELSPVSVRLTAVATNGHGVVVAVGHNGTVLRSTDLLNWELRSVNSTDYMRQVNWSGSEFIASDYAFHYRSADGLNWSREPLGTTGPDPLLARQVGSKYFTSGSEGTYVSDDKLNWSAIDSALNLAFGDKIAYTGTHYVARNTLGDALLSTDGLNWTTEAQAVSLEHISWNGSVLVSAHHNGGLHTSTDGILWTEIPVTGDGHPGFDELLWTGSDFFAMGRHRLLHSKDGLQWNNRFEALPSHAFFASLSDGTWAQNQFLVLGRAGDIYTSADGLDWARVAYLGSNSTTVGLASNSSTYVVTGKMGNVGGIWTSADGQHWTRTYTGGNNGNTISKILWNGSLYVAAGSDGEVLYSMDGSNWTVQFLPEITYLTWLVWTGNQFVMHGFSNSDPNGVDFVSADGVHWTQQLPSTTPVPQAFSAGQDGVVAYNDQRVLALGANGAIRTAERDQAMTYDDWSAQISWAGAASAREADPDGDGLSNWQEYAFDADPVSRDADQHRPRMQFVADAISEFELRPVRAGVEYYLESSSDLEQWSFHHRLYGAKGLLERIPVQMDGDRLFLRLRTVGE